MQAMRIFGLKFAVAFRGLGISLRDQSSLQIHVLASIVVLGIATYLEFEWWRWAVLILAITVVIAAELMNTAIERLVRVLHAQRHPEIGDALDTAAAAVLVTAIGAAAIGVLVLL
ncbi:Undecaprenol kinase [Novipirellula galeiformis]|uniref:Undecaprenol kinase n=1 Tax=Novipirellula galeiformis TaxID=2528004 RepID=A0A5C6BSR6_9BACT|nr:diacylglycerol kinase [Novipirellula galeiformis]TWU14995.1 Undecaprenol kinase [Novipirellula galeiformis]